jgi:hypothetical protein
MHKSSTQKKTITKTKIGNKCINKTQKNIINITKIGNTCINQTQNKNQMPKTKTH